MAKSRRSKVIHSSKTHKKNKELKITLIENIRNSSSEYKQIYLFKVKNMRSVVFKALRLKVDGRMFIGKNKVMAIALGLDESSELMTSAAKVAKSLTGNVGILFSNQDKETITSIFDQSNELDYARTGNRSTMTVVIEADPSGLRNYENGTPLSPTLEVQLRKAGMPTKLRGGSILLNSSQYQICRQGEKLNVDQTRILKIMGIRMAPFEICITGHLSEEGEFKTFECPFDAEEEEAIQADIATSQMEIIGEEQ